MLTWHENYEKKELPPEWMWPFPDELRAWFKDVTVARKAKHGIDDDDDDEDPDVVENPLFADFKRRARAG